MLNLHSHIEGAVQLWRERLSCSVSGCSGRKPWARITAASSSIRFNGRRYCFPRCFEKELRTHLTQATQNPAQPRPPHRVPLGLLMLARGELSAEQLRLALEAQKDTPKKNKRDGNRRIGEFLQSMGFVQEQQITNALGLQWACPVMRSLPNAGAQSLLPFELLRHFHMAPVHFNPSSGILHIAFAARVEYRVLLAIEQMLDCKAEPCIADESALQRWLESQDEMPRGRSQLFANVRTREEILRITSSYAAKFGAGDVRLARCGEYIWIRAHDRTDVVDLLFCPLPEL